MRTLSEVAILAVWHRLGGGEIRRGRANAFWRRRADSWAVAIDEKNNRWFDHVAGIGGGPLRLVEVVLGAARRDALRWLEDHGLIDGRDPRSPEQQAARRRAAAADDLMAKLGPWRRMRARELEAEKRAALEMEDFERLGSAARLLHLIQNGEALQVVAAFRDHERRDPRGVQRLIEAAAEDERHALMVAAYVANLLAYSIKKAAA